MLLEVIAETVEDAREAEQGGARRLELVRELSRGGLTPPPALIEAVVKTVSIPARVMIRESEPFEWTDAAELARLQASARHAIEAGATGLVLGFLRGGTIDLAAVRQVLGPLTAAVTFHRAFELAVDPAAALVRLSEDPRVDRVLTSGGAGPWDDRLARLIQLRQAAAGRLTILPGGGVDEDALRDLAAHGFTEAHIGRAARVPFGDHGRVRAGRVAALAAIAGGSYLGG